ncbi:MAG: trypsin-like peptidase domain-containing protein [Planctomycetota bacterium]
MRLIKASVMTVLIVGALVGVRASALESDAAKTALQAARELETAYIETIKKALPAYVFLDGGSGVLISADGYLLTNHHVITKKKTTTVRCNGKDYPAKTMGIDPEGDIALLKMDNVTNMPFLQFADSDALKVGQQVIAIGNPFDTAGVSDDPTVTTGIISALHRFEGNYTDAIQTDAAINPGNSGGPLVTLDGKLAGINGLIETKFGNAANTGVALAIPVKQIERFLPKLKTANGKTVNHGLISGLNREEHLALLQGVYREADEGIRNGAEIKTIAVGSPADRLGLKVGDKVTKIDTYPLLNFPRFVGVINTYPAGSEIKLTYVRDGATKTIAAILEEPAQGKLGIEMEIPGRERATKFFPPRIAKIEPNSPASKAGIKAGDLILAINGRPIATLREFRYAMQKSMMLAGDSLKLKVRRGTKEKPEELELTAVLSADPDAAKGK